MYLSLTYTRPQERFRIKDLEDLFDQYQLRIHHAMLINYLMIQLCLSTTFIISLLSGKVRRVSPNGFVVVCVCRSVIVIIWNVSCLCAK